MQRNMPVVSIQLDSSIAIKLSMGGSMFQERALMSRSDVWHRIKIVRGTQYTKDVTLKAILAAIEPADLIPVKYQTSGEDTFFIARNCGPALDKLCKTNLIIKNPNGDPLILIITLGFASIRDIKVNIQPLLLTALTRRYDPNKKALDLENFHNDPEISKLVYCPLTQQRTFNHVMKLAKNAIATIVHLNLKCNDLCTLCPLENSNLGSIRHIDLRHNKLISMDTLTPLRSLSITKLWLDGNPLCENYAKPAQYIESTKKYCANLIQLDGVYIGTSGLPLTYTSYFQDDTREPLINQFISHFFNLYDYHDRTHLKGLYHKNAMYSLSVGMPPAQMHKRNLVQFTASRNLLKVTDGNKRNQHLHYGQENVLLGLKKLPRSYHDRSTFVCDVMHDDGKCIVFSVGGLLKKMSSPQYIMSFSRTFVLVAGPEDEYNILNDLYYVDDAPEEISIDSIEAKNTCDEFVPTCFNASEKKELLNNFKDITTLNDDWSNTYLDEAKWNIRKAVSNFMKDYKSSAVPRDAFV